MDLDLLAGPLHEALRKGGRDELPEPETIARLESILEALDAIEQDRPVAERVVTTGMRRVFRMFRPRHETI
jgi:hypothetical protein